MGVLKSLRLMSKVARTKSGGQKVSSAHSEIIAVAAAVHEGWVSPNGLPGLLHSQFEKRVRELLRNNNVGFVKPKSTTRARTHVNHLIREELARAWAQVIGPLYAERPSFNPVRSLKIRAISRWVKTSIENPDSELNRRLISLGYEHLPELNRTQDWWEDRLRE